MGPRQITPRPGRRSAWKTITAALLLGAICTLPGSARADSDTEIVANINRLIQRGYSENEVTPSPRADDYEFARRAALDIIGHIPDYDMLMDFIEDESPDKRRRYVDQLLDHPDYVRNWTNIWGNLLVGRAGNRRANRGDLDRWLRNAIYRNMPYDQFVYELIAAEGPSNENGAVNFLANHLNDNAVPATSITSRIFLGIQVQCTQCHGHPFNDWKQSQFWSMNAFFRGSRTMRDRERNITTLVDEPTTELIFFERRSGLMQATERMFVDGTKVPQTEDARPRTQLARLITDPDKPFMSEAQVNRVWGHLMGFGFTRPIDDMGPHNPASHPELLEYLAKEFRAANYDGKRLIRWIAASEAYNLTSTFNDGNLIDDPTAGNTPLFSRMYLKSFTAEQLYDSLIIATQAHQVNRNSEAAENQRQTWLRQFVQTFGTDENDESTTFNGTIPQALVMMNGGLIDSAISGGQGGFLQRVLDSRNGDLREEKDSRKRPRRLTARAAANLAANRRRGIPQKIEALFLVALCRRPTESELEAFNQVFQESGQTDPIVGLQDVFWAILNSNEFIINH